MAEIALHPCHNREQKTDDHARERYQSSQAFPTFDQAPLQTGGREAKRVLVGCEKIRDDSYISMR
jgi:hypothetical protein